MSPIRARKALKLGPWFRVNFTLRSVGEWLRDFLPDGHVDPGRRPWSSWTVGPRGFTWNSRRRTARVDLPGPFSYETPRLEDPPRRVEHWTDDDGRRWEQTERPDGGTTTRYLPDPVSDDEAEQESCPRCGAEPGSPCRTRGTGRPTKPHLPRVELARLARAVVDEQIDAEIPPWGTPPR